VVSKITHIFGVWKIYSKNCQRSQNPRYLVKIVMVMGSYMSVVVVDHIHEVMGIRTLRITEYAPIAVIIVNMESSVNYAMEQV